MVVLKKKQQPTNKQTEYMTNDLNGAFLLDGQLPYVGDQPPAVVPVVHGLHVQHGGLDPGLILQGETQSHTQSLHRALEGSARLTSSSAGSPANSAVRL